MPREGVSINDIVDGIQGKGGGYRLTRKLEAYTLGEILRLTEGTLASVVCLECGAPACDRAVAAMNELTE